MNRDPKKQTKSKAAEPSKPKRKVSSRKRITEEVRVGKAKGRPMLVWVGKRPLDRVTAFPAQRVEIYNPTGQTDVWQNLLLHGDNKEVLAWLLANGFRGEVNLIYIDPPFDSGADYVRKVQLRGVNGSPKLEGESYTLGEQIQYTDIWANDNYLQFMYERLLLLKELLKEKGTIYLHCDWRKVHHLRALMDEVFGQENFINEIIWMHQIMGGAHEKRFPKAHETILWYAKGTGYRLRESDPNVRVPFSDYVRENLKQDEDGKWYYERRRMSRKATAEETASKAHTRTYVDGPEADTIATDVWDDMLSYQEVAPNRYGAELYPTQKTVKLLTRLIAAASSPGDLILDSFVGSGTTALVAQLLGRRWIGCDINKGAIQTTIKRLQTLMEEQVTAQSDHQKQGKLLETKKEEADSRPASLSFSVYRVNDYDLQIQHNEAINLACEHVGVERSKTDNYFDGKLGKRLVKITPFNHPLSPLDLEELKNELRARPEEDRDITVIALGKEAACDVWLDEWNRMRRQGRVPNQIEVIELRTDPKYGKFFVHKPAKAEVRIVRRKDSIIVDITDFLSPTIIERLSAQEGVLKPQITDWRSMVDTVMIDSNYDSQVFKIVVADVPETKTDLVQGHYELPAPKVKTTVALKITDMLGEEVLLTREI
jgi:DNA modification methylase